MDFSTIINSLIGKEKGFSDNPSDKGSPTNFGITEAVARQNGFTGDMRDLPRSLAESIYLEQYIIGPGFDKVAMCAIFVGEELIDTGVNMGPKQASIMFQRLLNAFNKRGSKYPDLVVDGVIGPVSIAAFKKYMVFRGSEGIGVFVNALNHLQGYRYLELAEKHESQEDFFYGWIKNRT